jgi:hypothetical protein
VIRTAFGIEGPTALNRSYRELAVGSRLRS